MNEHEINLTQVAKHLPSVCIPRVFSNITQERVKRVFEELNLGSIKKIDMLERTHEKGETFKRVFIHFDHWNDYGQAVEARKKLLSGKEIKIVYDDPWFWKVSENKFIQNKKTFNPPAPKKTKSKPMIVFDHEVVAIASAMSTDEVTDEFGRIPRKLSLVPPESPKELSLGKTRSPSSTPPPLQLSNPELKDLYLDTEASHIYGTVSAPKRRKPLVAKPIAKKTLNSEAELVLESVATTF
jgi:hypothetical protein